jgi:hypothetical protein
MVSDGTVVRSPAADETTEPARSAVVDARTEFWRVVDASTIVRTVRRARRPTPLNRPDTDAVAEDDGLSCRANLGVAENLETGTRPEATSPRRTPLQHAGTPRIVARDVIAVASLDLDAH